MFNRAEVMMAKGLQLLCLVLVLLPTVTKAKVKDFYDRSHYSSTFDELRHYRIILPRDYETSGKYYPVIYYFHGHSGRYKGEQYDNGQVFLPEMVRFVQSNDVIVVRWDGYVEEDYDDFYGGTPYDVQGKGWGKDFGLYFLELVTHIDTSFRTLEGRRYRATCGLSMGGFMSLYISARYPHLVGSASAFNPAHEFQVGEEGAKVLYKHANHVLNHGHSRVRLVKASGDYIGQHHDLLKEVYARTPEVDFQFRQDEYHRHWVTSIDETFGFHMRAFQDADLTAHPKTWDYDNAYPRFEVWGYKVEVENKQAGFVCFRDVSRGYFRVFTRQHAPDGPPVAAQRIRIVTPQYYGKEKVYRILDYSHESEESGFYTITSSEDGRLTFELDGLGHDIAIVSDREARAPVLLPYDLRGYPVVEPDNEVTLPIRLINTCGVNADNVKVTLTSEYPTVEIRGSEVTIPSMKPAQINDLSEEFKLRFISTEGDLQHCRLDLKIGFRGWYSKTERIDVRILPTPLPEPAAVKIVDGRTDTFRIFRQAGNQGGGFMLQREVTEGTGNGDGKADPGEEMTIWVKLVQGLDPADKNSWHRTKVFTEDPFVSIVGDIPEVRGREWTSVRDHTSVIRISPECPVGHEAKLFLRSESASFFWTPDARYGNELLYQAIQLHRGHVNSLRLVVGGPVSQ
jgi:predicted alpha/beta superfamily hydrolase